MHKKTVNPLFQSRGCYVQNENEAVTRTVNWAAYLDTDTISTSTWSSEDSSVTIANEANDTQTASARISGSVGKYRVVNKIVTANGDTYEQWLDVRIKDNSSGFAWDYGSGWA